MTGPTIAAAAALFEAADLIEARGLARGVYVGHMRGAALNVHDGRPHNEDGCECELCPLGALRVVLWGHARTGWDGGDPHVPVYCAAMGLLEEWLFEQDAPEEERSVPIWSDASTKEQVVAVLREVAAREVAGDA